MVIYLIRSRFSTRLAFCNSLHCLYLRLLFYDFLSHFNGNGLLNLPRLSEN